MHFLEDLQRKQDALFELLKASVPSWLSNGPVVDDELTEVATEWLKTLRIALSILGPARQAGIRVASTRLLLDLVAACSAHDAAAAKIWWRAAEDVAAGTKLVALVARVRGAPPWFVEGQRINWMYLIGAPDEELDQAEAAFFARYEDSPTIRALIS